MYSNMVELDNGWIAGRRARGQRSYISRHRILRSHGIGTWPRTSGVYTGTAYPTKKQCGPRDTRIPVLEMRRQQCATEERELVGVTKPAIQDLVKVISHHNSRSSITPSYRRSRRSDGSIVGCWCTATRKERTLHVQRDTTYLLAR